MRFTVDGSDTLEEKIAGDMAAVRSSVLEAVGPENITALVLGGGYGRGEGGVFDRGEGEIPYNDYDFFVVVPFGSRSRRRRMAAQLNSLKPSLEPTCGVHVDFGPPMPLESLSHLPYEIMNMEAKAGYHVVYGPEHIFDAMPNYDTARPPLEEGARLLMNRGVGLLMAKMLLREKSSLDPFEHEFCVRNMYKALMAQGDCVAIAHGVYSTRYSERLGRFDSVADTSLPEPARLRADYEAALAFKLRPDHAVPAGLTLESWLDETMDFYRTFFLWFERVRLNLDSLDWDSYAKLPARLPKVGGADGLRNLYRSARAWPGGFSRPLEWMLHPRDRILRRLPRLLAGSGANPREEAFVLKLWEQCG